MVFIIAVAATITLFLLAHRALVMVTISVVTVMVTGKAIALNVTMVTSNATTVMLAVLSPVVDAMAVEASIFMLMAEWNNNTAAAVANGAAAVMVVVLAVVFVATESPFA
ncbi:MAG TPA: hypothetical protein DCS35_00400, partial [Vibrio sp.]|nr:hypothetical protein [Vibrio sp.]